MGFAEEVSQDIFEEIDEVRSMRIAKIEKLKVAYDSLASSSFDIVNRAGIKSYSGDTEARAKHLFLSKIKGFLARAPILQDTNLISADIQFTSKTDKEDVRVIHIDEKLLPNIFTSNPEIYIDEVYRFIELCMGDECEDVTTVIFQSGEDIIAMLYYSQTDDIWKYNKIETFRAGE